MTVFGTCLRCHQSISDERLKEYPVICNHCGHTESRAQYKTDVQSERQFIKVAATLTLSLLISFFHATQWDKYSFEIIPLKIKELSGASSLRDLERIVQICLERKRSTCVERALNSQFFAHRRVEALEQLGSFQVEQNKFSEGAKTLALYFKSGGLSQSAHFHLAVALGKTGEVEKSMEAFEYALRSPNSSKTFSIYHAYAKMLIENKQADRAVRLIKNVRQKSPTANMFMQSEFKALTARK